MPCRKSTRQGSYHTRSNNTQGVLQALTDNRAPGQRVIENYLKKYTKGDLNPEIFNWQQRKPSQIYERELVFMGPIYLTSPLSPGATADGSENYYLPLPDVPEDLLAAEAPQIPLPKQAEAGTQTDLNITKLAPGQ